MSRTGSIADLGKLLRASGVGAEIDVTLARSRRQLRVAFAKYRRSFALSGGDDYELCFTAPDEREIFASHRTGITAIGGHRRRRRSRLSRRRDCGGTTPAVTVTS